MRWSVAVIGAGVSGLAMGLRVQRAGVPLTIFEKGSEVGGTWCDTAIPGSKAMTPEITRSGTP